MFRRLCILVLAALPTLTFAASKEMQELQRDVAQLQDQVRQLQQSQDKQLAALTVLVQQAVDASNHANTAVAIIQNGFQQSLRDQENKVVAPVVSLRSSMDSLSNDMRSVTQAVADLTSLLSKMQAQVTDLGNAMKVIQTPAVPPPGGAGGAQAAPSGGTAEAAPMGASDLYNHARGDLTGGKVDLALQEFSDYLKYYGNTDLAPNAQYYIGYIHYSQGNYDVAAGEFDQVLEKYPDNNKTADAMYYKGMSLLRLPGHKTQAGAEFREVIRRFPSTDRAKASCTELQNLGLRCSTPASPARKSSKRK
jgi:tol-pal system protein YbgF